MKVELTPDAEGWVRAAVPAGRFPTPEDAVRRAINEAKLTDLRAEIEAAEAEGGHFSSGDVRAFVRDRLDDLGQTPQAS